MEYLLRNRFVTGQVMRYRGRTSVRQDASSQPPFPSAPASQQWQVIMQQRVLATEPDGSAHVLTTVVPEQASPAQTDAALQAMRQVNYAQVDGLNQTVASSSPTPISTYYLPERPVAPGACWTVETPFALPPVGQVVMIAFQYTFKGIEEKLGRPCAVLELVAPETTFEVSLPPPQESMAITLSMEGLVHFDTERGLMMACEMVTRTRPQMGPQFATITQASQDLVSVSGM